MSRSSASDEIVVGASLGGFRGLTLEKAMSVYLKLSKDFNLRAVEVRFEREPGRPSLWHWEADVSLRSFVKRFDVAGAHLPFVYIDPISPNPRIRDESIRQLKEAMKRAAEIGMTYAVMHVRNSALGLSSEKEFEGWLNLVRELTGYAEENSIVLTLENANLLWDLVDVAEIVRKINSKWLKITLDFGHAHSRKVPPLHKYPIRELLLRGLDAVLPFIFPVKRGMPYERYGSIEDFIRAEKELIHVVHVHDYDGVRDHLGIGEGKIDFSFLYTLRGSFKGPYILEVDFVNHYEDFKKSYEKFLEFVEP
jgi:sugar phosphate isomerase/epimerase